MSIKKQESYLITCDCGEQIIVTKIDDVKKEGWTFESNTFPVNEQSAKNVRCPECAKKHKDKMYNSDNIRDRIKAGYYEDHPNDWNKDALEFVGLKEDHPKASKLLAMTWEQSHSSGYNEILNTLENLTELVE